MSCAQTNAVLLFSSSCIGTVETCRHRVCSRPSTDRGTQTSTPLWDVPLRRVSDTAWRMAHSAQAGPGPHPPGSHGEPATARQVADAVTAEAVASPADP